MKLKLDSGLEYCETLSGRKVCTGAKYGRPDIIPEPIRSLPSAKLHMVKLDWVDKDYDQGGAYWGNNGVLNVYCAWANLINPVSGYFFPFTQIFVWAKNRKEAKIQVRLKLANATFYR